MGRKKDLGWAYRWEEGYAGCIDRRRKGILVSDSFDRFWSQWPNNGSLGYEEYTRKSNKKKCREKWESLKLDAKADEILRNVDQRSKYDKGWRDKRGKYLHAPLVYLNNEQWDDGGYADVRDERRKPTTTPAQSGSVYTGPPLSRWARYANRKLLDLIITRQGISDETKLAELVRAKNAVVTEAEQDGDWHDEDFKSVIKATLHD